MLDEVGLDENPVCERERVEAVIWRQSDRDTDRERNLNHTVYSERI